MQIRTSDGKVKWTKQFGTSGDDRLAYGGNGLAVLEDGKGKNAIVMKDNIVTDDISRINKFFITC